MARSMPQYTSSAIAVIPREYAPIYFLPVGIFAGPLSDFGLKISVMDVSNKTSVHLFGLAAL